MNRTDPGRPVHAALLFVFALAAASCAGTQSQVRGQARGADAIARLFNEARPVWVAEMEGAMDAEVVAACDAAGTPRAARQCADATVNAAIERVERRPVWVALRASWEIAAASHARWRVRLMSCQRAVEDASAVDGGSAPSACGADLAGLARDFLQAANEARCALRGAGLGRLDTITEPLGPCPGAAADGGAR